MRIDKEKPLDSAGSPQSYPAINASLYPPILETNLNRNSVGKAHSGTRRVALVSA